MFIASEVNAENLEAVAIDMALLIVPFFHLSLTNIVVVGCNNFFFRHDHVTHYRSILLLSLSVLGYPSGR